MSAEYPLLVPLAVLILWSLVMLGWLYGTRIPAMMESKIDIKDRVGSTGSDLDGVLPDKVQWKAHNYNHLMEQPTLFYAIILALTLIGIDNQATIIGAWAYVAIRILHSLVHVTSNRVRHRFLLFMLASLVLVYLAGTLVGALLA